jgi:uncharacterized protein (TIGR03086 family)
MPNDKTALGFDRRALDLLRADVARLTNQDLSRPTPCDGWTVADLLLHMNAEHIAICGGRVDEKSDPRTEFEAVVERWLDFFQAAPATVMVPKMSASLPTEMVLATHATDMVVHRWDLSSAVARPIATPEDLLEEAHKVADFVTAEGSSLVGPGGVYKAALPATESDGTLDALVRKFGRDPNWRPRS